MRLVWIGIGLIAGVGGLVLLSDVTASDSSVKSAVVTGLPSGGGISWRVEKTGLIIALVDGVPLSAIPGKSSYNLGIVGGPQSEPTTPDAKIYLERHQRFAAFIRNAFIVRQWSLPSDALKITDQYSKELYNLPNWYHTGNKVSLHQVVTGLWVPYDEFGRPKPGQYGHGGGLLDPVIALTKNPLFQIVASAAIVAFGGPAGIAALGAYNMWQARGQELTLKNIALTAARSYAVSQCGELCGMAFDFGVGIASGKDIDEAAEDVLLSKLTPEQRAYYEQGKAAYAKLRS